MVDYPSEALVNAMDPLALSRKMHVCMNGTLCSFTQQILNELLLYDRLCSRC